MADSASNGEYALSDDEIREFVDRGYIILRGAVPPEWADALRERVFRKDAANLAARGDRAYGLDAVDLHHSETWPEERLCFETGEAGDIEQVSPRLWGAIKSLLGNDVEVTQRLVGGQFILNGKTRRFSEETFTPAKCDWHIDATSKHSRFTGRLDGLTLLVLFSDVVEGGGGTLFSGESLEHLVHAFEDSPGGIDTSIPFWARPIIEKCGDIFEFTGSAGDVLVSHPLAMHASQPNFSGALRVIENPTIMITRELDYRPDNPAPNPVEQAVIQRLQRPDQPIVDIRRSIAEGIGFLVEHHPDYLLPGRQAWDARVSAEQRSFVLELDRALYDAWTGSAARPISEARIDELAKLEATVALVVEVLANGATVGISLPETLSQDEFCTTGFSRLLRGFVSQDAHNHALALLARQLFDDARLVRLDDDHTAVRVPTQEHGTVWLDATRRPHLFRLSDTGAIEPLPIGRFEQLLAGDPERALHRSGAETRDELEALEALSALPPGPSLLQVLARLPEPAAPGRSSPIWTAYLQARGRMLMAQREQARESFEGVRKKLRPGNTTRVIATLFEDRLRFTEPALAALA